MTTTNFNSNKAMIAARRHLRDDHGRRGAFRMTDAAVEDVIAPRAELGPNLCKRCRYFGLGMGLVTPTPNGLRTPRKSKENFSFQTENGIVTDSEREEYNGQYRDVIERDGFVTIPLITLEYAPVVVSWRAEKRG